MGLKVIRNITGYIAYKLHKIEEREWIHFVELVEHRNITDSHVCVCILPYERANSTQTFVVVLAKGCFILTAS